MSTILQRIAMEAARELTARGHTVRETNRTGRQGLDQREAPVERRWYPLSSLPTRMCYGGHDVSDEPRDERGRWIEGAGAGKARQPDVPKIPVRVADQAKSEKPVGRVNVHSVGNVGDPDSENADRFRSILERFKALHPHQAEYAGQIKLIEEKPTWENWDRPIRWDGSTLRVRRGTSDFEVVHYIAHSISRNGDYKRWLEQQIKTGAIEVPRRHPELWQGGGRGRGPAAAAGFG